MIGVSRVECALPRVLTLVRVVPEMVLAGCSDEPVNVVVPNLPGLIHDVGATIGVLVMKVECVSNLVSRRPKILPSISAHSGIAIKIGECAPIIVGPHESHSILIPRTIILFEEVINHDSIDVIGIAEGRNEAETGADPLRFPNWAGTMRPFERIELTLRDVVVLGRVARVRRSRESRYIGLIRIHIHRVRFSCVD